MADTTIVSVTRDSNANVVSENVTFSDTANHNMTIVGIPGATYNLTGLPSGPNSLVPTISATEVNFDPADQAIAGLFNTSMQPQLPSLTLTPDQVISFTDNLGNTLSLLGSTNTAYDLNVLNYLLAVVNAIDAFMTLQYGDGYEQLKHEKLQLINLE